MVMKHSFTNNTMSDSPQTKQYPQHSMIHNMLPSRVAQETKQRVIKKAVTTRSSNIMSIMNNPTRGS